MFSIIIPVYNEEGNVRILCDELRETLGNIKERYEIIFVDDGSKDNTYGILEGISKSDKKVKIIRFRRNFGQTAAVQAGVDNSRGDVIITMDGDLQNDPRDIPRFLEKIREGYDVVSGWRYERKDPIQKRVFSKLSNMLARYLTGIEIHDFGCSLKAYKLDVLKEIRLYGEMHRYIPAIVAANGASISELKVTHRSRKFGKSKYAIKRLMKGFLDLLFIKFWMDFSKRPLHLFGFFGISQIFISGLLVAYNLFKYGLWTRMGPTLILSILLFFNGLLFLFFGFLGEVLIRIYYESKSEVSYRIEKTANINKKGFE